MSDPVSPTPVLKGRSDWLSVLSIFTHWRRFIVINVMIITCLAIGISFLFPKWYRATASILPPKESDTYGSLGAAGSMLKGLALGSLKGIGESGGAYNYFAILNSRRAKEEVVRKFGLIDIYDVADSSMERAVEELEGNVSFEQQDDESITIEVLDKDPQRAADIANYFVRLLNEISIELGTKEARSNREYLERQLDINRQALRSAEDSLRTYQERSGTMVMMSEEAGTIAPVAELYGVKAKKEVELAILKRGVSSDSPMIHQLEVEISELNRKLSTFPGVGMSSLRLYRDVAIQQKILEFLVPMYEQAKVEEQKDVPVLLMLDHATAPERKVKPQRLLIVFVAFSLSLLFSLTCAVFMHSVLTKDPQGLRPIEEKLRTAVVKTTRRYRVGPLS